MKNMTQNSKTDKIAELAQNKSHIESEIDSGLLGLSVYLGLLGKSYQPSDLRHLAGDISVFTFQDMVTTLRGQAIEADLITPKFDQFQALSLPAIGQTKSGTYHVIIRASETDILLYDPKTKQKTNLTQQDFAAQYQPKILISTSQKTDHTQTQSQILANNIGLFWFIPFLRQYKSTFALVGLSAFFLQLFALMVPLCVLVIIDKVLSSGSLATLNVLIMGLAIITLFDVVLSWMKAHIYNKVAIKIDAILARDIFNHLISVPLIFFSSRPSGLIASKMKELEVIRHFLASSTITIVIDFIFIILFLAVMWVFSPILTMIVIACLLCFIALYVIFAPILQEKFSQQGNSHSQTQSFLLEMIAGIETVKSKALEPALKREWEGRITEEIIQSHKTDQVNVAISQVSSIISKIMVILTLWVGAQAVISGDMSAGQFIAFNMLVGRVAAPALRLAQLWQHLQAAKIAVTRLADILETPVEYQSKQRSLQFDIKGKVEFEKLDFTYDTEKPNILSDINFQIPAGQITGLVGESGSGKSSIARLLQRLYVPQSGRVMIDNIDINHLDPLWLRRQIVCVSQEPFLFNRSIRENIAITKPSISHEMIKSAARLACADEFIERLPDGYDTIVGERGQILSGGQRQRIALARALIANPKILILDEATSALDARLEREIFSRLRFIGKGRTLIIITHRVWALHNIADHILCFDKGQLQDAGLPDDLLKRNKLYESLCHDLRLKDQKQKTAS